MFTPIDIHKNSCSVNQGQATILKLPVLFFLFFHCLMWSEVREFKVIYSEEEETFCILWLK